MHQKELQRLRLTYEKHYDAENKCCAESLTRWWPGTESNCRHKDFQSSALPTELPGLYCFLKKRRVLNRYKGNPSSYATFQAPQIL